MAEAVAPQNILILMTTGTNDALKTELAVVTAFGLRKNGHNVNFLMMGEAGSVINNEILRRREIQVRLDPSIKATDLKARKLLFERA